ncbi:MAG: RIP metalloprotease RseP [Nitrospirales bacterium]|nr:RIP metalloprotease RseP [Nitrospirales bacterium]
MIHNFFLFSPDSLYVFGQKIWWFLLVLGVLVSFHEYGHYLAARWVGVKVLKFSLGFGPKLIGRQVGDTEYLVSAIPLGGYVKLFGEDGAEPISAAEQRQSFIHQSLPHKMLIVAAGPGFNFLLSYLIFTAMLAFGAPIFVPNIEKMAPVVEAIIPGSPAEQAGLQLQDRIIRANDIEISTLTELYTVVQDRGGRPVTLDVVREESVKTLMITPRVEISPDQPDSPQYLLGIEDHAPLVGGVIPDTPAMTAGLKKDDRILQINDTPIATWSQMTDLVRHHPGEALHMTVARGDSTIQISIIPQGETVKRPDGKEISVGRIGIKLSGAGTILQTDSLLLAPWEGLKATWNWCQLTVEGLIKLIVGEISSKNLGGPLMIASISGEQAQQGLGSVAWLIAILSINLGILNLLPIPILDGGHLFFFACEAVLGRPLGERSREVAQQVGMVLLLFLMAYATWNDISRLLQ